MLPHAVFGVAGSVAGAVGVMAWRVQETRRPLTVRTIVLPPLGMATGLGMFVAPAMRVPLLWGAVAFAAGALVFSIPLSRTSRLERDGDHILLRRSRAFLAILVALAGLRLVLRQELDHLVSPMQTAALLYLLALGMIVTWRLRMLAEFRRLRAERPT